MLDAGRAYHDGKPPEIITVGDKAVPNFRKDEPPMTLLGREQKAWFKSTLARVHGDLEDLGQRPTARSTGAPIRRTFPPGSRRRPLAGRGLRLLRRRRHERQLPRARRSSTTSSATRRSAGSSPCRATATASGPAMRRRRFRPRISSRSGSHSSPAPSRPRVWPKRSSTASRSHPLRPLFAVEREDAQV